MKSLEHKWRVVAFGLLEDFVLHEATDLLKPNEDDLDVCSTTFLHYKNMLRLRDWGVKWYDMGGAKLDENVDSKTIMLTEFKSRFGGTPITAFGGSLYPLQKQNARVS